MKLTEKQIEELELQKEEAIKAVKVGEALKRLMSNPDYQLVIKQKFLEEYPREMADAIVKNTGAYNADVLADNIKAINVYVGFTMKIGADYNYAVEDVAKIEKYLLHGDTDFEEVGE